MSSDTPTRKPQPAIRQFPALVRTRPKPTFIGQSNKSLAPKTGNIWQISLHFGNRAGETIWSFPALGLLRLHQNTSTLAERTTNDFSPSDAFSHASAAALESNRANAVPHTIRLPAVSCVLCKNLCLVSAQIGSQSCGGSCSPRHSFAVPTGHVTAHTFRLNRGLGFIALPPCGSKSVVHLDIWRERSKLLRKDRLGVHSLLRKALILQSVHTTCLPKSR